MDLYSQITAVLDIRRAVVTLDVYAQPSQGFCRLDKARQAHHVEMKIANSSYTNIVL